MSWFRDIVVSKDFKIFDTSISYPSLAAFEAHLGALGAKPAHLRRICRAWLGSASAAWPDALGAEAE